MSYGTVSNLSYRETTRKEGEPAADIRADEVTSDLCAHARWGAQGRRTERAGAFPTAGHFYTVVVVAVAIDPATGSVLDTGSSARIKCRR